LNNNIIMHPAIAMGEAPGETCVTTALWDWSPVASWDSGKHWPSWQIPDDGNAMGYFGEGGGIFGVGESKFVLGMHHHNVAFSSRCGKNMSRFVVPRANDVGPPTFMTQKNSRSIPAGPVFSLFTMGRPPWTTLVDKSMACDGDENGGDLGVHATSGECLSHADIGIEYNWYPGVTAAVWRGDTDKHCYLCRIKGDASTWPLITTKKAVVFAHDSGVKREKDDGNDGDNDDDDDEEDDENEKGSFFDMWVEKTRLLETGREDEIQVPESGMDVKKWKSQGDPKYILKSNNFGANCTYLELPDYLQGMLAMATDPTNDTGVLYGLTSSCIARSYDQALTWDDCWIAKGLTGSLVKLSFATPRR
jgi:hypothetical protein